MSGSRCEFAREAIPAYLRGELPEVASIEAHLAECADCRAEAELARAILAGRADAPDGLAAAVVAAVRADRAQVRRPWWGLAAAAVAALALGIGVADRARTGEEIDVPGFAYEMGTGESWLGGDGVVAGAPTLEDLSDDELARLLDELSTGGPGGAA